MDHRGQGRSGRMLTDTEKGYVAILMITWKTYTNFISKLYSRCLLKNRFYFAIPWAARLARYTILNT